VILHIYEYIASPKLFRILTSTTNNSLDS